MEEEITLLKKRGTWKLVNKPKDRKVVGCRWTYIIKYGPNGEILRYKACLVAQGYSQIPASISATPIHPPSVSTPSEPFSTSLQPTAGTVAKTMSLAHFYTARLTTKYICANPKALAMAWTKSPSF